MTDEEIGAIWRQECAKANHITWAATSFARRIEAAVRERCAKVIEDYEAAGWRGGNGYHAGLKCAVRLLRA